MSRIHVFSSFLFIIFLSFSLWKMLMLQNVLLLKIRLEKMQLYNAFVNEDICICREGSPRAHFTLLKPPGEQLVFTTWFFTVETGRQAIGSVRPKGGRGGCVTCVRPPPKQNLTRRKGNFKQIQCQGSERSTVAWSKTCIYCIYIYINIVF